ncbi:MAG: CsbD family protein [Rhodospirillales bacterium]|nr:MAG: CsbD family protein [Rhodospirillales bacterium]
MRRLAFALALALSSAFVAPVAVQAQTSPPSPSPTTAPSPFWEKVKGSWTTTKGAVKEQWGKLTDDDLLEIEGRRDQLVGKLQQRYGMTREEAERQVIGWEGTYRL